MAQLAISQQFGAEKVPSRPAKIQWINLGVGAVLNIFQVTTLGQPLENIKTYVSANRQASLGNALKATWARGHLRGFYQGLIPWAWWEASTKGAVLILASSETQRLSKDKAGLSPTVAATLGGIVGGATQSYLVMGMTTCMKTVEVTRNKSAAAGKHVDSAIETFVRILRTQGIRGVNRGVNAVALRQVSGWASRMGISRFIEGQIKRLRGTDSDSRLGISEKIAASVVGGTLSCWNQPFEVIRVDMQAVKATGEIRKPTMVQTAKSIYLESGFRGFFRGVVPRVGVAVWATVCMVGVGDQVKEMLATNK